MTVDETASPPGQLSSDLEEAVLLTALRAGDESAFRALVARYHAALMRLARASVASDTLAEQVVQDTWLAAIKGIAGFDGDLSLKTWIFRILLNQARTRLPSVGASGDDAPAVNPGRFVPEGQRWAGHWSAPPVPWTDLLGERPISKDTEAVVARTIEALPRHQRQVVMLRDVEGWSAAEVCAVLGIGERNQRVLLHRGRSGVRARLEDRLGEKG